MHHCSYNSALIGMFDNDDNTVATMGGQWLPIVIHLFLILVFVTARPPSCNIPSITWRSNVCLATSSHVGIVQNLAKY